MKNSKNKKRVVNRKVVIICIIIFIVIISLILLWNLKKQRDLLTKIKNSYSENVVVTKTTNIYDKNNKVIGNIKKGLKLNLKKEVIKNTKKQYFNIKSTPYYINFRAIKPSKKKKKENINNKYITFNYNIKTNKKTDFYYDNKKVLSINKKMNLPIEYMDDNYYYVSYLNYILQVKKSNKITIIENHNTTLNESTYISILHYDTIDTNDKCNKETCIDIAKLQEHTKYLQEQGYYTITLEEFKKYLNKEIRLKEKAILLTTSTNNDILSKYNQGNEYKVELITEQLGLKFNNTNKKTTQESNKDNLDRYLIKSTTSNENFYKMVKGEDVIEIVITKNKSKEQSIPVLNYHFFYDSSIGESCNENICLDIKDFKAQLDYLKNNGYKTLKMEEFKKWMYNETELPEKSVLITIDDGALGTGKHNGNKLIPILEEYNMNATLFLISGWWDAENYRSKNLDIQSHTFDMHQAGSCGKGQVVCATKEELLNDLRKSLEIVDNNDSFCFPFYSYSNLAIETVKEAGFKLAFIGGNRKAKRSDNKFMIPRYPIHKSHTLEQFITMVN